jgi:hypothetical protein
MINRNHPIAEFKKLAEDFPNAYFEFSKYVHLGYGKTKSREHFNVQAKLLNEIWLEEQFYSLKEKEELAFHSRISVGGKVLHIPMIDFINAKSVGEIELEIEHITKKLDSTLFFYHSGQSLHGYYFKLISENKWYEYLGSLLLCNQPSLLGYEIVDTRWVGHCLRHGFSALRWSHNSEMYESMPHLIKKTI